MLVCFLACVKAGRAYCPVDLSMPHERIAAIIKKVGNDIAFATEEIPCEVEEAKLVDFISTNEINEIIDDICCASSKHSENPDADSKKRCDVSEEKIGSDYWVKDDDVFYIIFTSGSTGEPKGVKISAASLESFVGWMAGIAGEDGGTFLNQAPCVSSWEYFPLLIYELKKEVSIFIIYMLNTVFFKSAVFLFSFSIDIKWSKEFYFRFSH